MSSELATRSASAGPPLAWKPSRIVRLSNDSSRCLSDIVAKPHHGGESYSIFCDYHRLEDDLQRVFTHTIASKNFHRVERLSTLANDPDTCSVTDSSQHVVGTEQHAIVSIQLNIVTRPSAMTIL